MIVYNDRPKYKYCGDIKKRDDVYEGDIIRDDVLWNDYAPAPERKRNDR